MPVLMVALLALGVFGAIGALLTAAVVLETRKANAAHPAGPRKNTGRPLA